jgi:hypothetical protein
LVGGVLDRVVDAIFPDLEPPGDAEDRRDQEEDVAAERNSREQEESTWPCGG